jgi:hypothetical protein
LSFIGVNGQLPVLCVAFFHFPFALLFFSDTVLMISDKNICAKDKYMDICHYSTSENALFLATYSTSENALPGPAPRTLDDHMQSFLVGPADPQPSDSELAC